MRHFISLFCAAALTFNFMSTAFSDNKYTVASDTGITFSFNEFLSTAETVTVKGTLIADWLGYKNSEYSIVCSKSECMVASVEQIGPNQIGSIN
jgi:hypothetical protein